MAKYKCEVCGELIDLRGKRTHTGSNKCLERSSVKNSKQEENDHSICECGNTLYILTETTKVSVKEMVTDQEHIRQLVKKGFNAYCPRCLEVYKI